MRLWSSGRESVALCASRKKQRGLISANTCNRRVNMRDRLHFTSIPIQEKRWRFPVLFWKHREATHSVSRREVEWYDIHISTCEQITKESENRNCCPEWSGENIHRFDDR